MIPKNCRLFGQDHAPKQRDKERWRFNLKPRRSDRLQVERSSWRISNHDRPKVSPSA
jgi:hypothetical protein